MQKYVDEQIAALTLHVSLSCLRNWRWKGQGPKYRKVGRMIRYEQHELEEFMDQTIVSPASCSVEPTTQ